MTESEAIEVLEQPCLCEYDLSKTVLDCDIACCDKRDAVLQAIKALEEIHQYRALGTSEELRIAKEKQISKKPHKNFEKFSGVWCFCGKYLGKGYFVDKPSYCPDCGQALDWSDTD